VQGVQPRLAEPTIQGKYCKFPHRGLRRVPVPC